MSRVYYDLCGWSDKISKQTLVSYKSHQDKVLYFIWIIAGRSPAAVLEVFENEE